jgi:hypothetical protein
LSLSSGQDVSAKVDNLIEILDSMKENILCNHIEEMWTFLNDLKEKNKASPVSIDIVLDNCAIELAADLTLCDFLLRNNFVSKITLHAKAFYWFVSDVVKSDFDFLLRQIASSNSLVLNQFLKRFKSYINDSPPRLTLEHEDLFWTSSYSFDSMKQVAPHLYKHFNENSSLVIFKGDLNYRKLISDLDWPFETPLKEAVRGFLPTSLCAVRCIKSDLIANLDTNLLSNENYASVKSKFKEGDNKWMVTGDYGVIQLLKI